ncbi:MAG: DUF3108 domain-containing protein [Nitrospirota bacterium]
MKSQNFWGTLVISFAFHFSVLFVLAGVGGFELPIHRSIIIADIIKATPAITTTPKEKKKVTSKTSIEHQAPSREHQPPIQEEMDNIPSSEAIETAKAYLPQQASPIIDKAMPPPKTEEPAIARFSEEKLLYDIAWNGILAGTALLEVKSNEKDTSITWKVQSLPFWSIFYHVESMAESHLSGNGYPVNYRIRQKEGRYRSNKEVVFEHEKGRAIFFNHLNNTKENHNIPTNGVWDVLSGLYFLRTQPIEVGIPLYVDIFDSKRLWKVEVQVLRKEKIEIDFKEIDTIVMKPLLKSEGLFRKTGDIIVWLTDDEKKTPVKIETKIKVGSITATLAH